MTYYWEWTDIMIVVIGLEYFTSCWGLCF